MKPTNRRPLMVLLLILAIFLCNTDVVVAAESPAENIDAFNKLVMFWYRTVLTNIIFPLEVLSFMFCGIKLLTSGFLSAPQVMDNIKKQIVMSIAAFIVYLLLPSIIHWGVDIFRETGWKPPNYDGYHGPSFEFK